MDGGDGTRDGEGGQIGSPPESGADPDQYRDSECFPAAALGRIHSLEQVERAIDRVRGAAFPSWNLDLIFAIPGQSLADWEWELEEAMRREPDHISTYCLTFEEDTRLWVRLQQGQVEKKIAGEEADFHDRGWCRLEAGGYEQYEVSNFARPGAICRHNLNTWRMQEWLGYGPSAASQFGGRRFQRPADTEAWAALLQAGSSTRVDEMELDAGTLAADSLIFGLRMNAGIDLKAWQERFPGIPTEGWLAFRDQLIEEELAEADGDRLRLTPAGRLVADGIGSALLDLDWHCPSS